MASKIYTAPPNTGTLTLGKTLPDLLYDSCDRYENPKAFNQPVGGGWRSYSFDEFRSLSENLALGLRDLGLERGDRVAFFLDSDVYFCIADMGCMIGGLVNVPIYLTSGAEAIQYVTEHAEAKAIVIADKERLTEITPLLPRTPAIKSVIMAQWDNNSAKPKLPEGVAFYSMNEIIERGRTTSDDDVLDKLRASLDAHDLATLIYTSGTTGKPKGVMLTHENISSNALTAFSGMTGFRPGADGEVGISFLPLTHIFARTLHYGFMSMGNSVYFTTPDKLVEDLGRVKPTVFATVPRVLEKVYNRIQERINDMEGMKKKIGLWSLDLARQYELGTEPSGLYKMKLALADKLVYSKWREVLGGRVKYIICGGAALNKELANVLAAAQIVALQGYGLTETSPVITYNRPDRNRAGTVGEPMPGVEVMIADNGEILSRGPHIMQGYYKNKEKTDEVIDADGWFHTGDVGEFTPEGFLRITDRIKDLFKLSTGKYVMPQPLENQLSIEALIENAVVVGSDRKFCTALIFPEQDSLRSFARNNGLNADAPIEDLLKNPIVMAEYQRLVDEANEGMDHWSTIKRFALIPDHLTIDNGLLTPTLKVKRSKVQNHFKDDVDALYVGRPADNGKGVLVG